MIVVSNQARPVFIATAGLFRGPDSYGAHPSPCYIRPMWKKPGTPVPIDPSQVVIGLYIWLDISWVDHTFLTSRIMVNTEKEIAMIRANHVEGRL